MDAQVNKASMVALSIKAVESSQVTQVANTALVKQAISKDQVRCYAVEFHLVPPLSTKKESLTVRLTNFKIYRDKPCKRKLPKNQKMRQHKTKLLKKMASMAWMSLLTFLV